MLIPKTSDDNATMLTIAEIAQRLNMSLSGVRKLLKRNKIKGKRLGHRTLRFTKEQLKSILPD